MSNAPDKNHIIDAKAAALRATIDRAKAAVVSASRELERHHLWVERHRALYSEALRECQHQLKRQNLIRACKQAALLPIQLLVVISVAMFRRACAYRSRFRLRAELQNRIDRMEQRRRFPRQAPWRAAVPPSTPITRESVHQSQKCQTANDANIAPNTRSAMMAMRSRTSSLAKSSR